jgi:hypothetical protein
MDASISMESLRGAGDSLGEQVSDFLNFSLINWFI